MFGGIGVPEVLIVLLVVLLFFGAKRIPELARGIGQGINEFKKASDDIKKEIEKGEKEGFGSSNKNQAKDSQEHATEK
ncbi:MAG: twin-arginine translocase TatA/TatE family subunit [Balneolaceae bacterium]|nr:twin-arginine translocase TatA/TatE family subunit [Balneolaceae bacterium]